jgi:hypothetical protein
MNRPICLINQPAGIGDILYTLQIGHIYSDMGYRVVWPIIRQYAWLPRYLVSSCIEFPVLDDVRDHRFCKLLQSPAAEIVYDDNLLYIPLRRSTLNSVGRKYQLMYSKYTMVGLGSACRSWYKYVSVRRNYPQEHKVISYYSIREGEDFIFANSKIGSPDGHLQELPAMRQQISCLQSRTGNRVIENEFVPETTFFDFINLLCRAKEVHLPNSALAWLVEYLRYCGLTRSDQKRVCYPRDRGNPINDNWNYIKNCWDESQWFFFQP